MKFDPQKTLAVIGAWPNNMVTIELLQWLSQIGVKEQLTVCSPNRTYGERCSVVLDAALGQNGQVVAALARKDFDYFLFAENDIRPAVGMTDPFLTAAADIVCAEYETECDPKFSWGQPDSFHTGLWRTSRVVLEAINPPWFLPHYNDNGTAMVNCRCNLLRAKAKEKGFSIAHVGRVDHSPQHPALRQV